MKAQKARPLRESKYVRKMSVTSQMRNSALADNLKVLESSRFHNHSEFENVFDCNNGGLNPLYQETIKKCKTSAIMHVGLCLELTQIITLLKQLAADSGITFQTMNKISERKDLLEGIVFAPFWHYKIQNCSIIFWVLDVFLFNQKFKSEKTSRFLQIFSSYPQLIVTNFKSFGQLKRKKINLEQALNFHQNYLILSSKFENETLSTYQSSSEKLHFIDSLGKQVFVDYVRMTLKQNSLRCFRQLLKINLYILNSLSQAKVAEDKWDFLFPTLDNLDDIFDHAARDYLSDEVERKYELIVESFKNAPSRNQKELENELNLCQQQLLREVKKNIKILNHIDLQKSSMEASQKKLSANHQQILLNNKEGIKKQNYEILNELYEKLLNKFDKGRYASSKERPVLMAEDIQLFMEEYESKAIKSTALFGIFNTFMKQNRTKYYQKVQALEEQIDQNKKNQNFDGIFDPIEMKKKVLFTLEKQVRQMEARKAQIEAQAQRLKKLERRIELGVRMDTEGEQLYEVDSTKTMKAKQISPRFKSLNSGQNLKTVKADKKKRKCLNCCKCSIF